MAQGHVHEVVRTGEDYCYSGRVADAGAAAGNIEREEICSCGARRWVAINQRHVAEGMWTTYSIETRDEAGNWTRYGLGDSTGYASERDAERAIESLRALGGEWATAEYRVVEQQS